MVLPECIVAKELSLRTPLHTTAREDISCSSILSNAILVCSYSHESITRDAQRSPKVVSRSCVNGYNFSLLLASLTCGLHQQRQWQSDEKELVGHSAHWATRVSSAMACHALTI